jgi:crossover junction endodeoxyribonuclease RuvC
MIILGVDPGSLRTGYGSIQTDGRRHLLLEKGVLTPTPRLELAEKLAFIHAGVAAIIARLRPDILAVEDIFHAANARSALILGHVRGAVLLAGAQAGVPVMAFPPATVKLQVTGYGRAEKRQVALMVARLLELPGDGDPGDASDALAVALCQAHLHPNGVVSGAARLAVARRPS